jgi:hypothetical protein
MTLHSFEYVAMILGTLACIGVANLARLRESLKKAGLGGFLQHLTFFKLDDFQL